MTFSHHVERSSKALSQRRIRNARSEAGRARVENREQLEEWYDQLGHPGKQSLGAMAAQAGVLLNGEPVVELFDTPGIESPIALLEAIEEFRFDALIGGARRDEEKARAKERIFSHRDSFGQWQPKAQRPELWTLFNTRLQPGEHFRVFPISNWTELDVWQYIEREAIALPSIYYAHRRPVVERRGLLVPVTELTPPRDGEAVVTRTVRFTLRAR